MFFEWVFDHRKSIVASLLLITLLSLGGLTRLTITTDNRVFYGKGNSYFNEFLEFEANYTSNNNVLFVVGFPEPISDSKDVEAIKWLTAAAWGLPGSIRVDSLATYPYISGGDDVISISPILDVACPNNCIDAQLFSQHQLTNRFISPDRKSTGVLVTLNIEIGTLTAVQDISNHAEDIAREFGSLYPQNEIVMTGGVPMMQAFATESEADLSTLLPIAFSLIILLLYIFLGGTVPTIILVVSAFLSGLAAMGIGGWLDLTINNATSIVPLVVFTLVTASSMHLMLHFLRLTRENTDPDGARSSSKASLESNLAPILVSAVTSVIGLLSLTFVDSPPLQQLGWLSALGVTFGACYTLLLVPLLLSKVRKRYISSASSRVQMWLNAYARMIERRRSFSAASLALMSLGLLGFFNLQINDDFVDYFDQDTDFRKHTDRATTLLSGPNHIEVLVSSTNADGIYEPKYIHHIGDLVSELRTLPLVSNVLSYHDILRDLSIAFDKPLSRVETADEFAQWYLAYELSLQQGQSNTDFVNASLEESRISILLKRTTSRQIQEIEKKIHEWHNSRSSPYALTVTGENIPVAYVSELNIRSMATGLGSTILVAALIVSLVARNLRIGVATLTATIVPVVLGFGLWGVIGEDIGLATTAIIALTIGVVIDDSVHMLYRFMDGRNRLNLDPWQASAYAVHRVGSAISITSIILVAGLSVLLVSSFEVNSSFGAVTCLIIALALAFDLTVFPRLLVWANK